MSRLKSFFFFHAFSLGIRVIPEVDMPGHAYSFGMGYPGIVANCPALSHNINNVPLNPANATTFDVVNAIIGEMASSFSDPYIGLGGDEVVTNCWAQDPVISGWMMRNGYTAQDVLNFFAKKVEATSASVGRYTLHWQEAFGWSAVNSPHTIFQVWQDAATLKSIADAGRFGIYSFGWYFDAATSSWKTFYQNEPMQGWDSQYVIGGEACAWGEQVSDFNLETTIWPRALATAERLWSAKSVNDLNEAQPRLIQKICSLNARGVPSAPIVPGNTCFQK